MTGRWTPHDVPDLRGTTALVTGANAGLGYEIAYLLAAHGAKVLLACRDEGRASSAADAIRARGVRGAVDVRSLDLASLRSVDALAARVLDDEPRLDLLVNNAGVMAVDEGRTENGFETHLGVNHLGHFALTASLWPVLERTDGARVVTMSSMGHRAGRMHFGDLMFERHRYQRWGAYLQSKLANLLFTAELHRRIELRRRVGTHRGVLAVTAHPGASSTRLGFEGGGVGNAAVRWLAPHAAQSAALGALPAVRAATDPRVRGGEFYGPRFIVLGATPVRERPSRRARRDADARRLWERSEQLTDRTFLA